MNMEKFEYFDIRDLPSDREVRFCKWSGNAIPPPRPGEIEQDLL